MNKPIVKTLEELIKEVVKISNEDPLKAYIYLKYHLRKSPPQVTGALPAIWSKRKNWRKEVDLVGEGGQAFLKKLDPLFDKLRASKLEEFYKEMFE